MATNPHTVPRLAVEIAQFLLVRRERRLATLHGAYYDEARMEAWAERVIHCGGDNRREDLNREEAFADALLLWEFMVNRGYVDDTRPRPTGEATGDTRQRARQRGPRRR